jgi:pyruvate/2-oxoglutarate dehydrogenase complex dihydrolipoamide dehydrogenase (E3) component
MRNAEHYGVQVPGSIVVDFGSAMDRVRRVHARIGRESAAVSLRSHGVDVFFGEGRFAEPGCVLMEGNKLRFKKALIATGARPTIPPIPGLTAAGFLTYKNIFDLTERPTRLLFIGGGPIGCELSQVFCRLGSQVTIVQNEPMFLGREERDAAQILSDAFAREGIEIHLNTETVDIRTEGQHKLIDIVREGNKRTLTVDNIFVGVGQTPNVDTLNLESVDVEYDSENGIHVNDFLQTTNENIYAAGDVCAKRKFIHFEAASSRLVVQNALRSGHERMNALTIPWCTYTDPEIAHVGLYVREARETDIPVKTFTVLMHEVHRAICDAEEEGFVKIHVREGTDQILGATVVCRHAGEMINDISLAIGSGIGLRALANVVRPYPTQAAAIQMAADAFQRTHAAQN